MKSPLASGLLITTALLVRAAVFAVENEVIPYPAEKLAPALTPFWLGGRITDEPVLFLREADTAEAKARLLFRPTAVVAVRNSAGTVTYEEGRDYQWKPGSREIIVPLNSRIRALTPTDLRRPKGSQKYSLPHRDGGDDILFAATHEYHDLQTWITYDCPKDAWDGPVPPFAGAHLPNTIAKLRGPGNVRVALLGDSLSGGCNASGWAGVAPFLPPWQELLRRRLGTVYGKNIELKNLALGGSDSAWAVTRSDNVIEAKPDLVIIAFGGNDAHKRMAADYRDNIAALLKKLREALPDCEYLLVAGMPGNRDWASLKPELFGQYRDALATLTGPGVALADLTSMFDALMYQKSYYDLTGNGVNHANDFSHRVYAQTMLALLDPATGRNPVTHVGKERQLLLNRSLIERTHKTDLVQHPPVASGVVLRAEKPWEGNVLYMSSMIHLDGLYRLIYRAHDKLCLALSQDGVHWEKPSLGLVSHAGSTDNNIIADDKGRPIGMGFSFLDPRPDTPRDERIKILIWSDGTRYYHYPLDNQAGARPLSTTWRSGVRTVILGSADGRQFRELPLDSDLRTELPNGFDGGSIFWSDEEKCFVGYFRWWDDNPAPHDRLLQDHGVITGVGVRTVFRTKSTDLRHWTKGQPMSFGGAPLEHLYENGTYPYFRAPALYVGLANRFNPGRRALSEGEEKELKIQSFSNAAGRRFTFASDNNDLVLLVAKPGLPHYDRPFLEAFLRPGLNPGNWTSRCNYAPQHGGLFPSGGTEMSFLVTRQHYQPANHIERMSLRLDGFASMRAAYEQGEFVTVPLQFAGDRLELNFSTSGAGEIRVELQDAVGIPLPGFSLNECRRLIGDRIAGQVSWTSQRPLSDLAGRPVRLRFQMSDANLYSFRFTAKEME